MEGGTRNWANKKESVAYRKALFIKVSFVPIYWNDLIENWEKGKKQELLPKEKVLLHLEYTGQFSLSLSCGT